MIYCTSDVIGWQKDSMKYNHIHMYNIYNYIYMNMYVASE